MSTRRVSNISLKDFRLFLQAVGCNKTSVKGGHEKWTRKDLRRPFTIQTHIDPVPEFIVRQILRSLNLTKEECIEIIEGKD
ncbi:MAG: type II toxin-antitoxin system HicA family toxin [Bacteroidota bacterium]|nr:type II toxin-antitoxin system HicA family toxin [Bacteroidota bacterium]